MEVDLLFLNSKWEILTELSKSPKSPMELSHIFNTSVANVSQQLRLMEAMDVVGKTKLSNYEKGKPRMQYYIKNEILYLVRLGKNYASKQTIKPEHYNTYTFNVLSSMPRKDHYFLLKFFWDNIEILSKSSIGIFKSSDREAEFLIITEDIAFAREKLSNILIRSSGGQEKRIICWSHNYDEVEQGIKKNDPHFVNLIKESQILLDDNSIIEKFKGWSK